MWAYALIFMNVTMPVHVIGAHDEMHITMTPHASFHYNHTAVDALELTRSFLLSSPYVSAATSSGHLLLTMTQRNRLAQEGELTSLERQHSFFYTI